jgi:inositol phosphorylceramide mannosyltransferase catalytic subunit
MAIPKVIYQTFKNDKLPFLTKLHIKKIRRRNPEYDYQFYDDARIEDFMQTEFGSEVYQLYSRITIGAVKADFFRYAILYKKGGVYLDIDSLNITKLDKFILPTDTAIIALENNLEFFVQWALIFEAGHPFLKKTLEIVVENLKENKHPNNGHKMTGPTVYSEAIKECINQSPNINFRQLGVDYDGHFKFHYRFSKFFLYGLLRKNHWQNQQTKMSILKNTEQ